MWLHKVFIYMISSTNTCRKVNVWSSLIAFSGQTVFVVCLRIWTKVEDCACKRMSTQGKGFTSKYLLLLILRESEPYRSKYCKALCRVKSIVLLFWFVWKIRDQYCSLAFCLRNIISFSEKKSSRGG